MKLELKHLAPYLPYGLKIAYVEGEEFEIETLIGVIQDEVITNIDQFDMKLSKPILRPLSDLTKQINHFQDYEMFTPLEVLASTLKTDVPNYMNGSFHYVNLNSCPYWIMEKLFEWHFDVFGLIEKGLAIDINTLEKI